LTREALSSEVLARVSSCGWRVTRNDVSVGDQGKECEDSEERMCVDEERLERKKERFGETVERKD
jgi:hypothetical protein